MKHIGREDVYNIKMALLRNYGYVARQVDIGDEDRPTIQVVGDSDGTVITVTVSTDGLDWVIRGRPQESVRLPLDAPLAQIAETIVAELERPR